MPIQHEENKALGTRGNQKDRDTEPHRDRGSRTGHFSETDGGQPFRVCGENRQRENTLVDAGRTIAGGVLDQLIESILEQLAENASRREILEDQLKKIEAIRQQTKLTNTDE